MERWSGRVAIVTGAGSGIGEAIAKALVKHGLKVVGVDYNNHHKVEQISGELRSSSGKLYAVKADVSKEDSVLEVFSWIRNNLGRLDVLVNNAGIYIPSTSQIKTDDLRRIYDINVIGLSIFTREALKYMKEIGVDDGHIVNITSIAVHFPPIEPTTTVYNSSKQAVYVLTEGLRRELVQQKSKIRVTAISPAGVESAILSQYFDYSTKPTLKPEDVADCVVYAIGTPPHVQVHEIVVRPVGDEYP